MLYNRAHVTTVALPPGVIEAQLEPRLRPRDQAARVDPAVDRRARCRQVSVYEPAGHDRLSDYAQSDEAFRYLETADHTLIINSAHIVELREIAE